MSTAPHRVRLSQALQGLLARTSSNASAAHRALLLLGANAAAYDLTDCRADIGKLLGEALDEAVQGRLTEIYRTYSPDVGQVSYAEPPADLQTPEQTPAGTDLSLLDDPFTALGIEV
ncbi:MAG: hypothetical protein ACLFVO_16630 [Chloroflexaceae bacterium]